MTSFASVGIRKRGSETCVCEIKYISQLHPAQVGYDSCWVFLPLSFPPILLPNCTSPHRSAGSCRQCGASRSPSPKSLAEHKKNNKAKREKTQYRTPEKAPPTSRPVLETALPQPLPYERSCGDPSPPSSLPPRPSPPRSFFLLPPPPSHPQVGW